jgi:hypothetical protein
MKSVKLVMLVAGFAFASQAGAAVVPTVANLSPASVVQPVGAGARVGAVSAHASKLEGGSAGWVVAALGAAAIGAAVAVAATDNNHHHHSVSP